MIKIIITQKLHTICEGHAECRCPNITGTKACELVHLANAFVTETNPVSYEMSEKDYKDFLFYVTLASLREGR